MCGSMIKIGMLRMVCFCSSLVTPWAILFWAIYRVVLVPVCCVTVGFWWNFISRDWWTYRYLEFLHLIIDYRMLVLPFFIYHSISLIYGHLIYQFVCIFCSFIRLRLAIMLFFCCDDQLFGLLLIFSLILVIGLKLVFEFSGFESKFRVWGWLVIGELISIFLMLPIAAHSIQAAHTHTHWSKDWPLQKIAWISPIFPRNTLTISHIPPSYRPVHPQSSDSPSSTSNSPHSTLPPWSPSSPFWSW